MSSFEEIQEELSTETAKTAFQLAWKTISSLGKSGWTRAAMERAMAKYAERYVFRHGQIKVLGMSSPVALSTIYTAVKVISPTSRNAYGDLDAIQESLRRTRTVNTSIHGATSGITVANNERFLNILGAPGAGKSTFLKRVGLEALLPRDGWESSGITPSQYTSESFPVYIELRRFRNEPIDVPRALVAEFDACGLPDSENFVSLCLSQGRLLLLFDGVDEVPAEKLDSAIQHIADFADKYRENRFITSCRTAFYKTFFQKFVDVELTLFDDGQIRTFVEGWFGSELDRQSESARNFLALLSGQEHRSTLELARTPLLLTFLCLVYDAAQKFPANRSSLYRRALMILMEKWAAEKRVHNSPVYADLHVELEMELLSDIAARAYADNHILFSHQELTDRITGFMQNTLNAPATLDAAKILEAIQIQQGLLVERAIDTYSFSHLTIQEYLTAEFFHTPARTNDLVHEYMFDERWREVFLLSAGLAGADELLLTMLDECDAYLRKSVLTFSSVRWTTKVAPNTGDVLADAAMRIFLLSLPLRFKRYEEHGRDRMEKPADELLAVLKPDFLRAKRVPHNLGRKSAEKWLRLLGRSIRLEKPTHQAETALREIVPDRAVSTMFPGTRYAYARHITKIFYDGLGLPEELHNLTRPKARELQSLLYGYKLIVDCKDAALRMSTPVWELICKRLGTIEKPLGAKSSTLGSNVPKKKQKSRKKI